MMLSARALLNENPNPTRAEIREALSGNLCRCTGYTQIVEAVELAIAEETGAAAPVPHWAARDGAAPPAVSRRGPSEGRRDTGATGGAGR
jgi:xanthine dehydrogenase iron-sulfur cluster and FAD-binding subunit A